jgi:hypothetical protein
MLIRMPTRRLLIPMLLWLLWVLACTAPAALAAAAPNVATPDAATPDAAGGLPQLLQQLPEASYADKQELIKRLAATHDPRVRVVLNALLEGNLYARSSDNQVFITRADGDNLALTDPLGSVLLLAAIGLAITFGVMGVINMAHGEMVMIGAYVTFVVQQLIRSTSGRCSTIRCSRSAAFLVAGLIGIADRAHIIRFLYGRPLETLLATWGLSLVLQQAVRTIFGAEQPRGRQSVLDERRLRDRRPHHHLQPAVDHLLRARRVRRAAGGAALHPLGLRCAR